MTITFEEEECFQLWRFPYFWSPDKIIGFVLRVYEALELFAKSKPHLIKLLNNEAKDKCVLEYIDDSGNCNWSWGFTQLQTVMLTSFYDNRGQHVPEKDTRCTYDKVTDLIKIFRHKYIHRKDLPDTAKECLFGTIPEQPSFDKVYISFWISRFPRLVLFLWLYFQEHADESWNHYYPPNLELDLTTAPQNLHSFLRKLNEGLLMIKSKGYLNFRYTGSDKTLEFYQLPPEYIRSLLSCGSSEGVLHVHLDKIRYFFTRGKGLEYRETDVKESSNHDLADCSIGFYDSLNQARLHEGLSLCSSNRIIFFVTSLGNLTEIITDLATSLSISITEVPLTLIELDCDTVQMVKHTDVTVGKAKNLVKLNDLLDTQEIDNALKGNDLAILLRREKVWIFQYYALPEIDLCFINRKIIALNDKFGNTMTNKVKQREFLKRVMLNQKPYQLIFITGKCGIGKTKFLEKLAFDIDAANANRFVIFYSMRQFLETFSERNCITETIPLEEVIANVITTVCQTDFEKQIVRLWFGNDPAINQTIRVEIFFDGLDEVSPEFQLLSYRVIELIRENCPSVRLWITSRDYMAEDIQYRFRIPAYQFVRLKMADSSRLISNYCRRLFGETYQMEAEKGTRSKFIEYSRACVFRLFMEFSDLAFEPLHCKMIAEFIVSVTNELQDENDESLSQIFEQINSNRMLVYIYEYVMLRKRDFYLEKYSLIQASSNSAASHNRNLHVINMTRSATILAIEFLFGSGFRKHFERQLLPETLDRKTALDQGFVQHFDELVFCNRGFAEYVLADFIHKVLSQDTYLGFQKFDPPFQKLLWKKMFCVTLGKHESFDRILFKHSHLVTMFIWLCNECIENEANTEITWFKRYFEWTKNSEYCYEQFKIFCKNRDFWLLEQNDMACALDPNVFMIWALSLGFKNNCVGLLDGTNPFQNDILSRQELMRSIKMLEFTESHCDSYIVDVTESET